MLLIAGHRKIGSVSNGLVLLVVSAANLIEC